MELKIIPKDCMGKDKKFEGHVIVEPLGFDEAMGVLIDAAVNPADLADKSKANDQMKTMVRMVKASKPKYKEVKLKRLKDGKEYKSVDELWFDSSCRGILTDVASQLFSGGEELGN